MNTMKAMLNIVYQNNMQSEEKYLERVLDAMSIIDRKFFVPSRMEQSCYDDRPLAIGQGQTISQPSTVAAMLLYAELEAGMHVLEVGAGSGWNACLIQYLVHPGRVLAVERISFLVMNAEKNLVNLKGYLKETKPKEAARLNNLKIRTENALDKSNGIWQEKYDRIIITAGIPPDTGIGNTIKKMADRLLKEKGMLLCPEVEGPLEIYKKNKGLLLEETQEHYRFVPLLEGVG